MRVISDGRNGEREVEVNTYDDITLKFADIMITEENASSIFLSFRKKPESLIFLDQLRSAVDEAIKWAREGE